MPVLKVKKDGVWEEISGSSFIELDTGLSQEGKAADAKAVGDAIATVSDLVGETSVSDQISNAIDGLGEISGSIDIDLEGSNESEAAPINADTLNGKHESELYVAHSVDSDKLGGYSADVYVKKEQINIEVNYKVVNNLTKPVNEAEFTQNMIWVHTDETIGKTFFDAHEPNEVFADGDVWFLTGQSSNVAFSSYRVGLAYLGLVNPIGAKMYMNGEWVKVEATIWQHGEWCVWWNGQLYENGIEFEHITGGWITEGLGLSSGVGAGPLNVTRNEDSMTIKQDSSGLTGILRTANKVSLKGISKLVFDGDIIGSTNNGYAFIRVWNEMGIYCDRNSVASIPIHDINKLDATVELPVGDLDLEYYIGFGIHGSGNPFTVTMRSFRMVE